MTELTHIGMPRRSGRYPWGSGENPFQSGTSFYAAVEELRKQGLSKKEIAQALKIKTVTELTQQISAANNEIRAERVARAMTLKQKGMSNVEIGKAMGINESSVRSLLNPSISKKQQELKNTVDTLVEAAKETGFVDVGGGVEHYLGISRDKLNTAVSLLEREGYDHFYVPQEQMGIPGQKTTVKVLAAPDKTYPDLMKDPSQIVTIGAYTTDKGSTFESIKPPVSVDSSRVQIVYGPDGGDDKDGLIELRRGVPDLDMGESRYAQVRILVDGDRYLKGMAVVRDDLPPGVDIRFNTNKDRSKSLREVLKPTENDPKNPFGASIRRQKTYVDENGKTQLTALNILDEEGDWHEWSRTLSSQMLSKQKPPLANEQLKLYREKRQNDFDSIMAITNPSLKKDLLRQLAEKVDADAAELKAMGLPRTASHVLIPIPEMKNNEIFAPNFKQGETVVLIRHPHGGIFEIPELVVNNRNKAALKVLTSTAKDAVGINAEVAKQLSGADFDGDTVLVIPNNEGKVKRSRPLQALRDFDPKEQYKQYEGMKVMSDTQNQMGRISNLITDMSVQGASEAEIVKAVKHSMVVIDAEKHKLNYKQSYLDNGIEALKKKYQSGGASTLISKASSKLRVPEFRPARVSEGGPINPKTGELNFVPTGEKVRIKKENARTGEISYVEIPKLSITTPMANTKDARSLMSSKGGTEIERVYADHANALKGLANKARLEMMKTPNITKNKAAAQTYAKEVAELQAALKVAQMNAPLERKAQIVAGVKSKARIDANPGIDADRIKKIRTQELNDARATMGAGKEKINITPRQWEAIQAGALSHTPLMAILGNADPHVVRDYATPKDKASLNKAQALRASSMLKRGYTQAEVADILGVSTSTVVSWLKNA